MIKFIIYCDIENVVLAQGFHLFKHVKGESSSDLWALDMADTSARYAVTFARNLHLCIASVVRRIFTAHEVAVFIFFFLVNGRILKFYDA